MHLRRTAITIAAVVAGLLAAIGVSAYLSGSNDRAYKGATLVRVFKVAKDVPKGYSGDQAISDGYVKSASMPQDFRPGTALTDVNALRGKVALTALSANQVVVDGMFVDPRTAQVTAAQRIPAGSVAITVSVDDVRGVAGLLVPGDHVNVMTLVDAVQHTLYQNVPVLFIGATGAPEAGDTTTVANPGSNLITFAVPQNAANRISLAGQTGGVYLTLVPPDYAPIAVPDASVQGLLSGPITADGK